MLTDMLSARLAPHGIQLQPVEARQLINFDKIDFCAAYACWLRSAQAIARSAQALRPAQMPDPGFIAFHQRWIHALPPRDAMAARAFFEQQFQPFRLRLEQGGRGFLTGYYEPCVDGDWQISSAFNTPVLPRPADLVSFAPGEQNEALTLGFSAARKMPDGSLRPYPARAEIENDPAQAARAILWLKDRVELFLVQVQGSARVRMREGQMLRLVYAGRNGHPYSSIGRRMIEQGIIAEKDMSLAQLKAAVRAMGTGAGDKGTKLLQSNASYIFFDIEPSLGADEGPIGGAGISLTPLRSIALDRQIWPYGLPFFLEAELPWRQPHAEPFCQLMIGQDTGSAILGPARADVFFGTGEEAGVHAGNIRHSADFTVFLPRIDA